MFWLLKKLISLGILIVIGWFVLNMDVQGRPVKDRLNEFVRSPLVQAFYRFSKEQATLFLQKNLKMANEPQQVGPVAPPLDDKLSDRDRKKLEELLNKQGVQH